MTTCTSRRLHWPKSDAAYWNCLLAESGRELESWFAGPEGPQALFVGRILPFDEKASLLWARLMAAGTAAGRPRSALDVIIAAVAEANECLVVTDNEKDFAGLKIINPLRGAAR